jgi:pyruvate dehydrogenase E2 component (dihydrolipoamide acetyltransferase)
MTSANAEPMVACREAAGPEPPAWDAFLVYAAARALRRFPRMAARFENDRLVRPGTDAIGVAVDLEGDLFVVPVAGAAGKTPGDISREIRELVDRVRSGDGEARRLHPAVLTVTNLGAGNVESFVPIINPPEASVLAAGKVSPQVVAVDGRIAIQRRIGLTLAADHRVVNGKYAADFLGAIVGELEAL